MPKILKRVLDPMRDAERGLPIFLALLVFLVFVLPALGFEESDARRYSAVVYTLLMITGVVVASGQRRVFVLVAVSAALALGMHWATWFIEATSFLVFSELATTATILLFCLATLDQVLRGGNVTVARIQGAISVYLLLGLGWAHAYEVAEQVYPGSFSGSIGNATIYDWAYYSFLTLTTVGYGDIVPVHRVARSLAIGEALTGQIYIAVLLARLVSLEVSARNR